MWNAFSAFYPQNEMMNSKREQSSSDDDARNSGMAEALGRNTTPRVERAAEAYLHSKMATCSSPAKQCGSVSATIRSTANEITSSTQEKIAYFVASVFPAAKG